MTLFSAILFSVFTSAMFFIKGQFFAGSGTTDLLSYFSNIPYICIIVIPSLCWKTSVSIYDDFLPFSHIKKIIYSFLKAFIKYSVLVLMTIPVCLLINLFGTIDAGQLFTSIIVLLLYGACLISLCIFLNELFSNKIAAFVISTIVLAVFNSIHIVPLYVNLPQFLTSLCKGMSFAWHFDAASKGIFDTRDIVFLLCFIALFILLTYLTVEIKKGKSYSKYHKSLFGGLILVLILLLLNCTRYYKRLDFSKNKSYSVSEYSKKLTSYLEDNLRITYYRSNSLSRLYPQIRDVTDFLTTYSILNNKISFTIKDPDKDEAMRTLLQNYGVTSQQLQNVEANSTEYINVYSAIVMEYQNKVQLIPFIMSSQTLEYDIDLRLKNLISSKAIGVNIVVGNGMSLSEDYSLVVPWLNSQGLEANILYIEDPAFISNLELASGPIFVIGDSEINIDNSIAIENYILSGKGNGIFAVSPYSAAIDDDWSITANNRTNIVEMLENWGVRFTDKIAADISSARITMYAEDGNSTEVINYPLWISLLPQQNSKLGMTLFWPVALELSGNAVPYLVSSSSAYTYKTDRASPKRLIETNPFVLRESNISDKQKATQILGAQITGRLNGLYNLASCEDSNIIVISDPYFLNTLMTGYIGGDFGDYRNFEFISNCILNLAGESELAKLQSKTTRDTSLYKINDLTQFARLRNVVYIMIFIIMPLIIIAIYTAFLFWRKRWLNLRIKI